MATVLTAAYVTYKVICLVANTPTPIVVVLSGSMEPAFQRGDILFMWNRNKKLNIGDVVVYDAKHKTIPIVHRILRTHSSANKQLLLTKGDNNPVDDLDLYGYKKLYLDRAADVNGGFVWAYFPWLGYATIFLNDYPQARTALVGLSVLFAFFENE